MGVVAISGSQGSGKSTILAELNALGYRSVDRKTSRSILSDWGVTLQEVNNNSDLTIKFQDEIIERKFQDESSTSIRSESPIWYTERTYADLFTYALVSLGKDNHYTDWLSKYYKKCMLYQQSYDLVYYLKAGFFNVVSDGVRGAGRHYSRMVDLTMLDFTQQMTHPSRLNIIETPDIDERVTIISQQSRSLLLNTHINYNYKGEE
jgi:predicted ATPase